MHKERVFTKKLAWHEIVNVAYKHVLCKLLNKIEIRLYELHCTNMLCKEQVDDINDYHSVIKASCMKAASRCISTTSKPIIAGWNDLVRHFKDQSIC